MILTLIFGYTIWVGIGLVISYNNCLKNKDTEDVFTWICFFLNMFISFIPIINIINTLRLYSVHRQIKKYKIKDK